MKKTLLLFSLFLIGMAVNAQVKSTGVVTFGTSGITAQIDLDNGTSTATLTFTGPSNRWFALQIGSEIGMESGADMVYATNTGLIDCKMNGSGVTPSTDAINNWTVSSNTVSGTTRTIVATRAFSTGDTNDYTFNYDNADIDFIWAKANSASYSLAYHGASNKGFALNSALTLGTEGFQKAEIKIYPNPVADNFFIESEVHIQTLRIYNIEGKLMKELAAVSLEEGIDISSFSNGVYFLEMESAEGILYKKLVKE